jgi:hypothetical protein
MGSEEGLVDKTGSFSGLAAEDRRHGADHLMPRLYRGKAEIGSCSCMRNACGVEFSVLRRRKPTKRLQRTVLSHSVLPLETNTPYSVGRHSSVGIATRYGMDGPGIESWWDGIFSTDPDGNWGPPSLLRNGYRIFPWVKRPGCGIHHPTHPSPRLKKEYSYSSSHPLRLHGRMNLKLFH